MAALTADLRSDTITRPTPEMRRAMAEAEVGDDVLGDDPTIHQLQDRIAEMMGKEAACFVPSGTMANLTAIRALTEPGDEIIGHRDSHFYQYETGGFAAVAGCSFAFMEGERGQFTADDVSSHMRAPNAHFPHSALLVVENTHNRGGGSIWPVEKIQSVTARARELDLKCHLDGARLWNACVATGKKPGEYAQSFDTISCCFSKGLGAPVGSCVSGSAKIIQRVHRFRKMLGGTMRQSGVLAAAALYALDHHFDRLTEDHANAKTLAEGVAEVPGIMVNAAEVETNIVYIDVDPTWGTAADLSQRLSEKSIHLIPTGPQRLRAVTHLDVNRAGIDYAVEMIDKAMSAAML